MKNIKNYNSLIFDCDGVILNSNKLKIEAFRKTLKNYNSKAVEELIIYLKENFGKSRYILLDMFIKNILPKYNKYHTEKEKNLNQLIQDYSNECKNLLINSEVTDNLKKLREVTSNIPWFIVSGGDQRELREVFKQKKIYSYFNGGIFGSPDKKKNIIQREIINKKIKLPALMFGDSKLDYMVAKSNNIDFLFVTQWTELKEYKSYCIENSIITVNSVSEII